MLPHFHASRSILDVFEALRFIPEDFAGFIERGGPDIIHVSGD
jgi:hypothetical protein